MVSKNLYERRLKLIAIISPIINEDFVHVSKISEIVRNYGLYNDFCEKIPYSPSLEKDLHELWKIGILEKTPYLSFDNCECHKFTFPLNRGGPAYKLNPQLNPAKKIKLSEIHE